MESALPIASCAARLTNMQSRLHMACQEVLAALGHLNSFKCTI